MGASTQPCDFCSGAAALCVSEGSVSFRLCYGCLPAHLGWRGVSSEVIRFFLAWAPPAPADGVPETTRTRHAARLDACPGCGLAWEDALGSRLLGCPECYSAFDIALPRPA